MPRSRPSKVPFLRDVLYDTPHIFYGLSETWLLDQNEAETKIEGYQLIRADRKMTRRRGVRDGGGVALYINDKDMINHKILLEYSCGVIEAIAVHLRSKNLVIIMVYRQPENQNVKSGSVEFKKFLTKLDSTLKTLISPLPDILLCGDFNLPHAIWSTGGHHGPISVEYQTMISDLFNLASEHFMIQVIDSPTHRAGNTLDLIFTNNANYIHSYSSQITALSDHKSIECKVRYRKDSEKTSTDKKPQRDPNLYDLNFFSESINWPALRNALAEVQWRRIFLNSDPCEMMDMFLSTCFEIAKDYVPLKHISENNSQRVNIIPRHCRRLMRNRSNIHNQLLKVKSESRKNSLNQKLIEIEKKLQCSHDSQRTEEESKAVGRIKTNPKYFYSYAQRFSKVKVGIGPLLDSDQNLTDGAQEMSEILSQQYASVFSKPTFPESELNNLFSSHPPDPGGDQHCERLEDVIFDESDIEEAISELSSNSAAGPDNFPAKLLKECKSILSTPIYIIWRESLNKGIIPMTCKSANIVPIHKGQGKSRDAAKNYRPVALTSILIKIFEKIIRKRLVEFFEEHDILNKNQHGFRTARSCLSQLLSHFDKIISLLEEGKIIDVIYLDFAKAFDKLDIGITLKKLKHLGINGKLGKWLTVFLSGRIQSVIVNGHASMPQPVISGVPQGSVLGPLLFLILIGDIDSEVAESFISSFADDTRVGKDINDANDIHQLQADLTTIYNWAKNNNMELNDDKFEHLRYLPSKTTQADPAIYYSTSQTPIEQKTHLRDLGVTMSDDATFKEHISVKTTSMKSTMGWILRTFRTREALPLITLWKALVLSIHDYCSQLWNPSRVGDIQTLEMVQYHFTKRITSVRDLSYWERLAKLRLYSLQRRRERYIAIYVWKILEGTVPNISDTASSIKTKESERLGRSCHIPPIARSAPSHIKNIRETSFSVMGPRIFNCLPHHIRDLRGCSTNEFKSKLDTFLRSVPDEPLIQGYTQYRRCDSNSLIDWLRSTSHLRQMEDSARTQRSSAAGSRETNGGCQH